MKIIHNKLLQDVLKAQQYAIDNGLSIERIEFSPVEWRLLLNEVAEVLEMKPNLNDSYIYYGGTRLVKVENAK